MFRQRWHVELDLRNIKTSLEMDDLRGRTPEMVRREIWVHWLTYNLIRKTIAQAALTHEKYPRQLSFAAGLAAVASAWAQATSASPEVLAELAASMFRVIVYRRVGHRPNRVEPRGQEASQTSRRCLRNPASKRGRNSAAGRHQRDARDSMRGRVE